MLGDAKDDRRQSVAPGQHHVWKRADGQEYRGFQRDLRHGFDNSLVRVACKTAPIDFLDFGTG